LALSSLQLVNDEITNRYRLAESKAQERLNELAAMPVQIGADDISLLRMAAENSADSPTTLAKVSDALCKAISSAQSSALIAKQYIPRADAVRLAQRFSNLVHEHFHDVDSYESRIDQFTHDLIQELQ